MAEQIIGRLAEKNISESRILRLQLFAHHSRLWNRRFAWKPQLPQKMPLNWMQNVQYVRPIKLYAQFFYLAYLEQSINFQKGNC